MTPKEKALELGNKMYNGSVFNKDKKEHLAELQNAKRCALIAVDEIIKELTEEISPSVHGFRHKYWQEVKQEIEKL